MIRDPPSWSEWPSTLVGVACCEINLELGRKLTLGLFDVMTGGGQPAADLIRIISCRWYDKRETNITVAATVRRTTPARSIDQDRRSTLSVSWRSALNLARLSIDDLLPLDQVARHLAVSTRRSERTRPALEL